MNDLIVVGAHIAAVVRMRPRARLGSHEVDYYYSHIYVILLRARGGEGAPCSLDKVCTDL